jgi:hypothetical protein
MNDYAKTNDYSNVINNVETDPEVKTIMHKIFNKDKLRNNNYTNWFEDTHPYTSGNSDIFTGLGRLSSHIVNPICNNPKLSFLILTICVLVIIALTIYFEECQLLTPAQIETSNEEILYALLPYTNIVNDKFSKLTQDEKVILRKKIETGSSTGEQNYSSKQLPLIYTDDTKIINL